MPPLITLLLVGVGAYASYRWLNKKGATIAQDLKRAQAELKRRASGKPQTKDLGTLKLDPESGEYKPDGNSGSEPD